MRMGRKGGRQGGAEPQEAEASQVAGRVPEGTPGRRQGWPEPEGQGEARGAGSMGLQGHSTRPYTGSDFIQKDL